MILKMSSAKVSAIFYKGDELMMYIDEYYEEMGRQFMTSIGTMQNTLRLRYVAIFFPCITHDWDPIARP